MRKWLMGATCAALLAGVAQEGNASVNGEFLWKLSASKDKGLRIAYEMYVNGVANGVGMATSFLKVKPIFCVTEVPPKDQSSTVRTWMRNNKDALESPAYAVVFIALAENFPCD